MFTLANNFYTWVKKRQEKNLTIILIGLDNAGKTTLLYGLKNELPKSDVTPTIGFRPSKLVSGKYTIQWFDVGGAKNFRRVWQSYYPEVHGVIFVVDAANAERFDEARESLEKTLESEGVVGKPVLIFANKQDLEGCISAADLSEKMGMAERKDCRFHVAACQAKPSEGKEEVDARIGKGLKWLLDAVDGDYKKLHARVTEDTLRMKAQQKKEADERRERAAKAKAERLREQEEREAAEAAAAVQAAASAAEAAPSQGEGAGAGEQAVTERGTTAAAWAEPAAGVEASADAGAGAGEKSPEASVPPRMAPLEVEGGTTTAGSPGRGSPAQGGRLSALSPLPPPIASDAPPTPANMALPNAVASPPQRSSPPPE